MRRIESTEEIKQISLGILCAVDEFCTQNGIMYSLACGTLIGAIRHKGFIPWDDDVDIYMKRCDYDKFMSLFPETYKDCYSVLSLERSAEWNRPFAKAFDVRTLEIEDVKYNIKGIGLGIDIFPIDNAPDDDNRWNNYERKRKLLRNIYVMKSLKWRSERSLVNNLLVVFNSFLLFPFSYRRIAIWLDKYSKRFNDELTQYYAENCYGIPNNRFLKEDFTTTLFVPFEKFQLQVMSGYDHYLRCFYGDYMQLPPEEKRQSHHSFEAYWKV